MWNVFSRVLISYRRRATWSRRPLPAANHHGFPPKRKQTKKPRYINAIVKTSTDLIPAARIPALRKFFGAGIAMIAFTLAASSFGLSDTPPANPNPHPMTVDDVDHVLEVDSPQLSPDGSMGRIHRAPGGYQGRQKRHRPMDGKLGWDTRHSTDL